MAMLEPKPEGLPPPSAALVLLRVFLEAHLSTIPPKQAAKFLRRSDELMALFEEGADVLPLRAGPEMAEVRAVRRSAAAWYRRVKASVLDRI